MSLNNQTNENQNGLTAQLLKTSTLLPTGALTKLPSFRQASLLNQLPLGPL